MRSWGPLNPRFGGFIALGRHGFTQVGYTAWGFEDAEPGRGRSAPVPQFEDYGTPLFSRPMYLGVALWRVWEHVERPVLILRGENSDLLRPETVVERKRRGIAAKHGRMASIQIANCWHAPALMADEQVRPIEDFLLADKVVGASRRRAAAGGRVK